MSNSLPGEVLVILSDNDTARVRSLIEQEMPVLHSVSPRVFVVQDTSRGMDYLARMEDDIVFTASALPQTALSTLDERERQWAAAWNLRQSKKPPRPGEGLPWDAPGFSPPDRPNGDGLTGQDVEEKEQ